MKIRTILGMGIVQLAVILAAGCTKTVVDISETGDGYIRFSTVVSRAAVEEAADIHEFGVWSYNDDSRELSDEKVYLSNGSWVYDNLKKWTDGVFMFGALYPYGLSEDVISGAEFQIDKDSGVADDFKIPYYNGSSAEHDLMTAVYTRNYSSSSPDMSPVIFNFKHLLSRIRIDAMSGSGNVTVNSVEFSGMGVYGTYNEDSPDDWYLIPIGTETPAGSFSIPDADIALVPGSSVSLFEEDLLLIPQEIQKEPAGGFPSITLKVGYTQDGDAQPREKTFTLPETPVWEMGKSYRYILKFNMEDVGLSVKVLDWDVVDTSVEW